MNAVRIDVAIRIDLAEAARVLSPAQLAALFNGIAQVIAAQRGWKP